MNELKLEVILIAGIKNEVGDAPSRWAYPASQGFKDTSWHGTRDDHQEMKAQIRIEQEGKRACSKAAHPADDDSSKPLKS